MTNQALTGTTLLMIQLAAVAVASIGLAKAVEFFIEVIESRYGKTDSDRTKRG